LISFWMQVLISRELVFFSMKQSVLESMEFIDLKKFSSTVELFTMHLVLMFKMNSVPSPSLL